MTDDELQAIEARANAATAGPWLHMIGMTIEDPFARKVCSVDVEFQVWTAPQHEPQRHRLEDTRFIAHARTDVPALVAEVRRLRKVARLAAVRAWESGADRGGGGQRGSWIQSDAFKDERDLCVGHILMDAFQRPEDEL